MSLQPLGWLSLEEAEDKVRPLRISSMREYVRLFKQEKLPKGLPSNPSKVYKNKGWISRYEFLGNETPSEMLPFKEATKTVRSLGIKSVTEYQTLYKQGKLPRGLPYAPNEVYAKERINR